ncbi:MAG: 3-hydroxybutyryl-CoA dehydrogenase [Parvularculaceae bacterium]
MRAPALRYILPATSVQPKEYRGAAMTDINSIGVIGAGQMGSGIAHVCAAAGFQVVLQDVAQERVDKALAAITKNMERQVAKGKLDADAMQSALERITPAVAMDAFGDCDLVIEAATENQQLKGEIFQALTSRLKADAFVASNTSSISITWLASKTDRPERFIGMHFMNPVPVMQLVEVIRGIATSDETFEMARALVDRLGKTIAVAEDYPGFIVNRILMPMINEAIYALYEGVGDVEAIDTGLTLGANHPMGPLTLADFIGLDTCLAIMQVLHEGLADSKYRPCPLLVKYVEAGWLGRKTGRGFYDYSGDTPTPTR